jgi:hypothetical protein
VGQIAGCSIRRSDKGGLRHKPNRSHSPPDMGVAMIRTGRGNFVGLPPQGAAPWHCRVQPVSGVGTFHATEQLGGADIPISPGTELTDDRLRTQCPTGRPSSAAQGASRRVRLRYPGGAFAWRPNYWSGLPTMLRVGQKKTIPASRDPRLQAGRPHPLAMSAVQGGPVEVRVRSALHPMTHMRHDRSLNTSLPFPGLGGTVSMLPK